MTRTRFHASRRALLTLLLALAALAQAQPADGFARIHYQRPDGDYAGWELHVWEDTTAEVTWADGLDVSGRDDYGVYWDVPLAADPTRVGFIVHRGDDKDPGPDMFLEPERHGREVWLLSGSDEILTQPPLGPVEEGTARVHYHRPDGDYEGWELHVWEDAAEQVTWQDGLEPAGRTPYGLYWTVRLREDAARVGLIVHRGDDKDPGPDMFLDLAEVGNEAWLVSGSSTVHASRPDIRAAGSGDLGKAQAHWLGPDLIAWSVGTLVPGTELRLHASPAAALELTPEGVTGGASFRLEPAGALPQAARARFPHLAGAAALRLEPEAAARAGELLRGQVAVSMTNAGGLVDATGLQTAGVLDALYAEAAADVALGASWREGVPTVAVWAPTARRVRLLRYEGLHGTEPEVVTMAREDATGVWRVVGAPDWEGDSYLFQVEVVAPSTGRLETNLVTDPYAVALTRDSARAVLVDLDDPRLEPDGWDALRKPGLEAPEDTVVLELHLRDFSAYAEDVPAEHRGTYLAFTHPDSAGARHLRALADAGLTHLHLLPTFDLATIPEDPAARTEPAIPPIEPPTADPGPQRAVDEVRDLDAFNWGYDPWHYTTPEGSYATEPDGPARTREFREMVMALADLDLRIVADVVYNHTNAAGQGEKSVLDRIVPGYYHRLDANGYVTTSTCCPNTATEHAMMRKLMVDSVVLWARAYKIDGFRFDLMGHHMVEDMLAVRAALDRLTLEEDGVDGRGIVLYGEGWDFGEVAGGARGINATQRNLAGTGIGTFNDRLRDAVRGGGPFDSGRDLLARQGFASGLGTLPDRDRAAPPAERAAAAARNADLVRLGLAGNLAGFRFESADGSPRRGDELDYNGQPAGYAADPQENVVYVSKHDNRTLWDVLQLKLPEELPTEERARLQTVALSTVALAQGVPFFHAGSDLLRSKSFDRNSYNSGDHFNRIDWTAGDNNYGVGLPPAADNRPAWQFVRPLLERSEGRAEGRVIEASAERFRALLRVRASSELFRLETADEVQARLAFHNTGPTQVPGVIVMTLADDVAGLPDLDPAVERVLVVFNATPRRQTLPLEPLAGEPLVLHPALAEADERARASAFYSASGRVSVPAFTTAVFVLPEAASP